MKKVGVVVSAIIFAIASMFVGRATASTQTDIGGLDFVQITETYNSPATGNQNYKAECPSGYNPIGGGGFSHLPSTNNVVPLLASYPYDDGTSKGWAARYNVTSSSWVVLVYAICLG